jgi:putative SOS response-associated peptidase YedK
MCGRYFIDMEHWEIQMWLHERFKSMHGGDVLPTQMAPLLTLKDDIEPVLTPWGFKRNHQSQRVINARSETVMQLSLFKSDYAQNKAIVLASGFYEWDAAKIKQRIIPEDDSIFYMAALIQGNNEGFAILTQPAQYPVATIHDRQPVMIPKKHIINYLNGELPEVLDHYYEVDMKVHSNYTQTSLF